MMEAITLPFEVEVYTTDSTVPTILGSGWQWDKTKLKDADDQKTYYSGVVPENLYNLREGTRFSWWGSGTQDIKFLQTNRRWKHDLPLRVPVVTAGLYSTVFDRRPLFSDYSVVDFLAEDLSNDVSYYVLPDDVLWDSLDVVTFRRDAAFTNYRYQTFSLIEAFSGADTQDVDGNINFSNVNPRMNEMVIQDGVLYFTRDVEFQMGAYVDDPSIECIEVGYGSETGRQVYLEFFPVRDVRLWIEDGSGGFDEFTLEDSLNVIDDTELAFSVDYELGILTLGGYQAPSLLLSEDIDGVATEIPFYFEGDIDSFPDDGIIVIGTEQIRYLGKERDRFVECERGYNSTTPDAYLAGTEILDIQHGAGTDSGSRVFCQYTVTPRVEFEVTDSLVRTANRYPVLDVSPHNNLDGAAVLQIYPVESHVSELTLETDRALIGGDHYGPVFYGTDTAKLIATALDSHGNPVDGIEITIEITEGQGLLNAANHERVGTSNSAGQVTAFYNAPYSEESVLHEVTAVSGDTVTVDSLPAGVDVNEVTLFQILKHDKSTGTIGTRFSDVTATTTTVTLANRIGDEWLDGIVRIVAGATTYYRVIASINLTDDPPVSQITFDEPIVTVDPFDDFCYVMAREAVTWDPVELNGTRVLLYQFSTQYQHPITGDVGAYGPVRPISISGNDIVYDFTLPVPEPSNDDVNLGGYVVVAPTNVTIRAHCIDPATNQVITSNAITFELELPKFLKGVDEDSVLPIPIGFQFLSEEFNTASGLGGDTFITVNPSASGIDQFSIALTVPGV